MTEASATPEKDKLIKTLTDMDLNGFDVTWGPEAADMTPEERAACINQVLVDLEKARKETVEIRVWDLQEIYQSLLEISRLIGGLDAYSVYEIKKLLTIKDRTLIKAKLAADLAGQALPKQAREDAKSVAEDGW